MQSQVRVYDIHAELLDEWLDFFREKVVPMHRKHAMPARAAWVDRERSRFVWVRDFAGEGSAEEQEQRYYESPERAAEIGDAPKRFIRSMQVTLIEAVYDAERTHPITDPEVQTR